MKETISTQPSKHNWLGHVLILASILFWLLQAALIICVLLYLFVIEIFSEGLSGHVLDLNPYPLRLLVLSAPGSLAAFFTVQGNILLGKCHRPWLRNVLALYALVAISFWLFIWILSKSQNPELLGYLNFLQIVK
jgi:hypothetical protein